MRRVASISVEMNFFGIAVCVLRRLCVSADSFGCGLKAAGDSERGLAKSPCWRLMMRDCTLVDTRMVLQLLERTTDCLIDQKWKAQVSQSESYGIGSTSFTLELALAASNRLPRPSPLQQDNCISVQTMGAGSMQIVTINSSNNPGNLKFFCKPDGIKNDSDENTCHHSPPSSSQSSN